MAKKQFLYIQDNWVNVITLDPKEVIKINTEYPVFGIKKFTDVSVMESDQHGNLSNSLEVKYRYSIDSIFWSEEEVLTRQSVVGIPSYEKGNYGIRHNHPFQIEYTVTNPTGYLIDLISISLDFEIQQADVPDEYLETCWSDMMPFYDRYVLIWAANLLEKIYRHGIVPMFIKRGGNQNRNWEDKSYIDFWWCIAHLAAFRILFTKRLMGEVLFTTDMLKEFLRQRNVFTSEKNDISELYYLANNYYNEIRRRGTQMIFSNKYSEVSTDMSIDNGKLPSNYNMLPQTVKESQFNKDLTIRGELLRLLGISRNDLEIYRVERDDCGWYVGKSSPTYTSPTHIDGFVKRIDFPIFRGATFNGNDLHTLRPASGICGIGIESNIVKITELNQMCNINTSVSYEITFLVRKTSVNNGTFSFGVSFLNEFGEVLSFGFFFENQTSSGLTQNVNYFIRGIVYSHGSELSYPLNIGTGNQLKFPDNNMDGIIPYFSCSSPLNMEIRDLKIRPANSYVSDYLSQTEKLIILNNQTNREYSDNSIQEIIDKFLVDYSYEFNYVPLKSSEIKNKKPYIVLNRVLLEFGTSASSQTFELDSNVEWEVKNSHNWITLDKTVGQKGKTTIRLNVQASEFVRIGTVIFHQKDSPLLYTSINIEQREFHN
jgi:hypothetical protein